jgi:hypothetical protein
MIHPMSSCLQGGVGAVCPPTWWVLLLMTIVYATSTRNPPYKQLLIGLGTGAVVVSCVAGVGVVVSRCAHRHGAGVLMSSGHGGGCASLC